MLHDEVSDRSEGVRKVPLKKPVEVFTQESKPYLSIQNVPSLLYRNGITMSSYRLFLSCYCTASTAAAGTYFISSKFISQVAFDVAVKHDVMACTKVGLHQPPPLLTRYLNTAQSPTLSEQSAQSDDDLNLTEICEYLHRSVIDSWAIPFQIPMTPPPW